MESSLFSSRHSNLINPGHSFFALLFLWRVWPEPPGQPTTYRGMHNSFPSTRKYVLAKDKDKDIDVLVNVDPESIRPAILAANPKFAQMPNDDPHYMALAFTAV